jgi:hypothetical protein
MSYFLDIYEELGITYRYKIGDIIKEHKKLIFNFFIKKTISQEQFLRKNALYLFLEEIELKYEYDLYYFDYFKIQDKMVNIPVLNNKENQIELYFKKQVVELNKLESKSYDTLSLDHTLVKKVLNRKLIKLFLTPFNIIQFSAGLILILLAITMTFSCFFYSYAPEIMQNLLSCFNNPLRIIGFIYVSGFCGIFNVYYRVFF